MSGSTKGCVVAIAVRTKKNGPMLEIDAASAAKNGGIESDLKSSPDRGITFISSEQWREVQDEFGVDLPWHTRRANVLTEGLALGTLFGKTLRVGTLEVHIIAETEPCGLMDKIHQGLQHVLTPECRAGVYGRVTKSGSFAVGDEIAVIA